MGVLSRISDAEKDLQDIHVQIKGLLEDSRSLVSFIHQKENDTWAEDTDVLRALTHILQAQEEYEKRKDAFALAAQGLKKTIKELEKEKDSHYKINSVTRPELYRVGAGEFTTAFYFDALAKEAGFSVCVSRCIDHRADDMASMYRKNTAEKEAVDERMKQVQQLQEKLQEDEGRIRNLTGQIVDIRLLLIPAITCLEGVKRLILDQANEALFVKK